MIVGEALWVSIGVVALAEMGNKTQLLALLLAARFRRPWPIVAGIVAAAATVEPGGIIRVHDGSERTIHAVPVLVRRLRERSVCPGRLAVAEQTIRRADGVPFRVTAVSP